MLLYVALSALIGLVMGDIGPCPVGFDQNVFDGSCYFFSDQSLNFDGAGAACGDLDAELVAIESEAEYNYVKSKLPDGDHYTSGVRVTRGFYWSTGDYIPLDHYGWSENEPNNVGGQENCVELRNNQKFFMNDLPCAVKNSYICDTFETACPEGSDGRYYSDPDSNGCYFINDNADSTWLEANAACGNLGYELISFVTVRSIFRNMKQHLRQSNTDLSFWISGRRGEFQWGNGKILCDHFPGWGSGEPNNAGGEEDCVEFQVAAAHVLNDIPCNINKKFVCERRAACPEGFVYNPLDCACYLFPDASNKKSMTEAQAECQVSGADLVSYETAGELNLVTGYLQSKGDTRVYWTSGTRVENAFYWASGEHLGNEFAGWSNGEPNDAGGNEDCAELRHGFDFYMNDLNCADSLAYICEMDIDTCVSCVSNADFGSCYFFSTGPAVNWQTANTQCIAMNGQLISLNSEEEFNFIRQTLKDEGATVSRWIGGTRANFVWGNTHTLPNTHSGWNGGEPNDHGGAEDCVEVSSTGSMNDLKCTDARSFVCEKPGKC